MPCVIHADALHLFHNVIANAASHTDVLKPAAHVRKELSKMPREADSSAVSSRVR